MKIPFILPLGLALLVVGSLAAKKNEQTREKSFKANIGRFHIPINDDRLNNATSNITLLEQQLPNLYNGALDYYVSYDEPPSSSEEFVKLRGLTEKELPENLETIRSNLLKTANESLIEFRKGNNTEEDVKLFDLANFFLHEIVNLWNATDFWSYGNLMGVGRNVKCSDQINQILKAKDEWEKAGSQAAVTLMALVPTMLSFGNLYVGSPGWSHPARDLH